MSSIIIRLQSVTGLLIGKLSTVVQTCPCHQAIYPSRAHHSSSLRILVNYTLMKCQCLVLLFPCFPILSHNANIFGQLFNSDV